MLTKQDREIIRWHTPDDKKPYTIWHLKFPNGPSGAFEHISKIAEGEPETEKEWIARRLLNNIEKVENYDGKTLTDPNEIADAVDGLRESNVVYMIGAINREPMHVNMGLIEKN